MNRKSCEIPFCVVLRLQEQVEHFDLEANSTGNGISGVKIRKKTEESGKWGIENPNNKGKEEFPN